jgi:quercetin dioxygenase-like cupin family protein
MRKYIGGAALLAATGAIIVAATALAALATPPSGATPTLLAKGRFAADIDARTKTDIDPGPRTSWWKGLINTKGASDLEVLEVRLAPSGTFGWHSHPGPSLVIVKSGTATFYMAGDPTCTPHVVQAGEGFVDNGGDVHLVRNEGNVELVNIVASLIPAGATRRIDESNPYPGTCPS